MSLYFTDLGYICHKLNMKLKSRKILLHHKAEIQIIITNIILNSHSFSIESNFAPREYLIMSVDIFGSQNLGEEVLLAFSG